jgi:hypothetical protein
VHKALTYVNLPPANRKSPGDTITQEEWDATNPLQTEEDIQSLIDQGAISEDMNAEIHPDHLPVDPSVPTLASMVESAKTVVDQMGDDAPAELKDLAELDYQHVVGGDAGSADEAGG